MNTLPQEKLDSNLLQSISKIDLSIPKVLANEPAIGPGGVANGVYADYQEEALLHLFLHHRICCCPLRPWTDNPDTPANPGPFL